MRNAGRFVCIVAAALAFGSHGAAAQGTLPPQVIDIGQPMLLLRPAEAPIASLILIPGGTTHPTINSDGSIGKLADNFLMEQRDRLMAAGFAVGIVEKPEDLRAAIARMRTIRSPVFVLGHSDGTIMATNAAIGLGSEGPDGIGLLSSVVVTPSIMPRNVLDYPLGHITIPVLLVRNVDDTCRYSPPSGMDEIAARLTKASVTTVSMSSSELEGSPCENLAPHSYFGIEAETIAKVVEWLKVHSAAPK